MALQRPDYRHLMVAILSVLGLILAFRFRSCALLELKVIALHHQLRHRVRAMGTSRLSGGKLVAIEIEHEQANGRRQIAATAILPGGDLADRNGKSGLNEVGR